MGSGKQGSLRFNSTYCCLRLGPCSPQKKQTKTYKRYEPKKVTDYTVNTFFAVSGSPAWGSYYAFIGFIGSYAVLYCLFSRLFYGCLRFFCAVL